MVSELADITGILLAGGQSRRMGGGDKGLLQLAGKTMLQHVIDRVAPQVGTLAINANGDPARFDSYGLAVIPDTVEGFAGPLAGVLAGMRWAERNTPRAKWIATFSTDAPLLPRDLVAQLRSVADQEPTSIAIARSDGHLHPVIGLWPICLADDLESALHDNVRKVLHWTDRHGTLPVDFAMVPADGKIIDPFFNANTPEELALAEALIGTV